LLPPGGTLAVTRSYSSPGPGFLLAAYQQEEKFSNSYRSSRGLLASSIPAETTTLNQKQDCSLH
jgi:hypothetical protein